MLGIIVKRVLFLHTLCGYLLITLVPFLFLSKLPSLQNKWKVEIETRVKYRAKDLHYNLFFLFTYGPFCIMVNYQECCVMVRAKWSATSRLTRCNQRIQARIRWHALFWGPSRMKQKTSTLSIVYRNLPYSFSIVLSDSNVTKRILCSTRTNYKIQQYLVIPFVKKDLVSYNRTYAYSLCISPLTKTAGPMIGRKNEIRKKKKRRTGFSPVYREIRVEGWQGKQETQEEQRYCR